MDIAAFMAGLPLSVPSPARWLDDPDTTRRGEAPSVREIGRAVGLSSPSSVLYQPRRLEQAGAVVRASGSGWRDYRLS
ncbi:LexA family protein [Streptomyces sp. NPDC054871]